MPKYTITIVLDVPDEMLAAVHDVALNTIRLLREQTMNTLSERANFVTWATRAGDHAELIAAVKADAKRMSEGVAIVSNALSEITHTMNDANSEWQRRRSQPTTAAPQPREV